MQNINAKLVCHQITEVWALLSPRFFIEFHFKLETEDKSDQFC